MDKTNRPRKLDITRQLQRVAALRYNPNFKKEVEEIRIQYGITADSRITGTIHRQQHHTIAQGDEPDQFSFASYARSLKERPDKELPKFGFSFGIPRFEDGFKQATEDDLPQSVRWYLSEIRRYRSSVLPRCFLFGDDHGEPAELQYRAAHSRIPFEGTTLDLMRRYGIPLKYFDNILIYTLMGRESALLMGRQSVLSVDDGPLEVHFSHIYRREVHELKVTITGVDLLITKNDWMRLWDKRVKVAVENLKKPSGIRVSTKRSTKAAFDEQMKRYSEWYELSEGQRLGPAKALDQWGEDHPDRALEFDPSTVTHAIQEFKEIITPSSSN